LVRIGDADRERVAGLLRDHTVEGRLTLEEFAQRLDEVFAASSERELVAALRELPDRPAAPPAPKKRWLVTLLGSVQRRGRWTAPRRIFAFSLLGAPDFDFRQASVTGDVRITSVSLIGALTAIVPPAVDVELGGIALIGGNDLMGAEDVTPPVASSPKLRIHSYALIGGARVTFAPPQS
jgi:hypothetical protein